MDWFLYLSAYPDGLRFKRVDSNYLKENVKVEAEISFSSQAYYKWK